MHLMQPGHLRDPADARETGEVGHVVLVTQRDGTRRRAHTGPEMDRVVVVALGAGEQHFLAGRPVQLQLEVGIRHRLRACRMLAALFRLAPFLAEEQARTPGGARAASTTFLSERDTRCAEDHHRNYNNCRAPHVDLLVPCFSLLASRCSLLASHYLLLGSSNF